MGENHPRIVKQPDQLDPVVGLLVDRERQIQAPLRQQIHQGGIVCPVVQYDFDTGPFFAQEPKRGGQELRRRGLEHPDPNHRTLATIRRLDAGFERLEL